METRRFTRLTNRFGKKWQNHYYALALYFAYYNFCNEQDDPMQLQLWPRNYKIRLDIERFVNKRLTVI